MSRPPLSQFPTAGAWLDQFRVGDQKAAAAFLDAILLLNEEQVSNAIRTQLDDLCKRRKGKHRRIALYAEREFETAAIFKSVPTPDKTGRLRMRAIGRKGPEPVRPIRG